MKFKNASPSVGLFLAIREIKRSNPWTTALIIFVMTLTFLNMVLLGGILIGLAQGLIGTYRHFYTGDVFLTPPSHENTITNTQIVTNVIKNTPSVGYSTTRYTEPATLEYKYQTKIRLTDIPEVAIGTLTGIDPKKEDGVSNLSAKLVAGSYLNESDVDAVVLGSTLIKKYTTVRGGADTAGSKTLQTADVGSRVRLTVNGIQKQVVIKGVITTNNPTIDGRIFMNQSSMRKLINRNSLNANEIAIKIQPGSSDLQVKKYILTNLPSSYEVQIQTAEEAIPNGTAQITDTFAFLGNIVGSIALFVGAITIFIVIYVNAITRRKYIGILKGIGITTTAIEISYIIQALFYATAGIIIASFLLLGFLVPFFSIHPINYPLGQGALAISVQDVTVRAVILLITSLLSGFIPARLVTKQNTLDAILGR